jgi:hypothetical protein
VCPWLRSTDSISAVDHYAPARSAALAALTGDVVSRLSSYYRPDGNYAGATFLSLCPNEPDRVTGSDLFAVTLLSVDIGARTTRRLLTDEDLRAQLRAVPSDVRLEEASADVFDAAGTYYETVKRLFVDPTAQRSRPWVAPAKLVARKRPHLLPVRDELVRQFLGIDPKWGYRGAWEIYQQLMRDGEIRGLLDPLAVQDPPLRVLDVALWTKARS